MIRRSTTRGRKMKTEPTSATNGRPGDVAGHDSLPPYDASVKSFPLLRHLVWLCTLFALPSDDVATRDSRVRFRRNLSASGELCSSIGISARRSRDTTRAVFPRRSDSSTRRPSGSNSTSRIRTGDFGSRPIDPEYPPSPESTHAARRTFLVAPFRPCLRRRPGFSETTAILRLTHSGFPFSVVGPKRQSRRILYRQCVARTPGLSCLHPPEHWPAPIRRLISFRHLRNSNHFSSCPPPPDSPDCTKLPLFRASSAFAAIRWQAQDLQREDPPHKQCGRQQPVESSSIFTGRVRS